MIARKPITRCYLKYHKAGLTTATPVTSTTISPVKMSIARKSLTNLRSKMIFLQGKPVFLYLPTIYTPMLQDNPLILFKMDTYVAAKGKVGHVTSFALRSSRVRNISWKWTVYLSVLCLKVSMYQFCRKQLTKLANLLMHSQCALSEPISSSRKTRKLTVCRFI